MQSTQEIAELMLDSGRNALLALDIKVSIATLGVGTGALVAGFFGMNVSQPRMDRNRVLTSQLVTQLEQTDYAFVAVAGTASALGILVFIWGARILRKVRRVALSGRAPPSLRILAVPMRHGGMPIPTSNRKAPRVARASPRRPGAWARLFGFRRDTRRFEAIDTSDPHDPIWINKQADQARARDAFMAGWTGKSANAKDWEEMREAGNKDVGEDWRVNSRIKWNKD